MKVCMISTTHDLYDSRIYFKEALSLKKNGYDIVCIAVGDKDSKGKTDDGIDYIIVRPVIKKNKSFLTDNIFSKEAYTYEHHSMETYEKIYSIARDTNSDFYHLHDLYLNFIGNKLKKLNSNPIVIYDVHETYPRLIIDFRNEFRGLKKISKYIFSQFIGLWEVMKCRKYDYIINVEKHICKRFSKIYGNKKTGIIYNYSTNKDIDLSFDRNYHKRKYDLIYCGGITKERGIMETLFVVNYIKQTGMHIKAVIVGCIWDGPLKIEIEEYINCNNLHENIIFTGKVPHNVVNEYYKQSKIGLISLHENKSFKISIPIKLFEYMYNGLPVISSNLPNVKEIIKNEKYECGEIVEDIKNIKQFADAILKVLNNSNLYEYYSKNAKMSVKEFYNWEQMERRMVEIYDTLSKRRKSAK